MSAGRWLSCDGTGCNARHPIPAGSLLLAQPAPIPRSGWLRTWEVASPEEWYKPARLLDFHDLDCLLRHRATVNAARVDDQAAEAAAAKAVQS